MYALGVLVFRMLTGGPLFAARHPIALQRMHLFTPSRAPSAAAGSAPESITPGLDAAILRALAKAPEARQASAAEFLADLRAAG